MGERAVYAGGITDGFRLTVSRSGTGFLMFALALKGGDWKLGERATRTDGNDIALAGLPSKPSGTLILGNGNMETTSAGSNTHDRWIMGAWASTSKRAAYGAFDESGVATSETSKGVEHNEMYLYIGGGDTADGLMDIRSVEATGEPTS